MRVLRWLTALASLLLLAACTSSSEDPPPAGRGGTTQYCTISLDLVELERIRLHPLDEGGPNLDRYLRATRSPEGDLCVDIVIDHSDPGSTAISYRIVARRGGQEWRTSGEDHSGQPPLLVGGTGCLKAKGFLVVLGAEDRSYRYRARLQVRCDR